ncbi:hypothetical protein [Plantactinospora endophytica]|uniref:Uncharacterized protein n=1 Tax=Plantactinospora endophytica TaxID=673535 RepID=A0ABQ4EF90_9ACTN|nr:hypothetical protein [Plantactinospora endophytica]GIG93396.1 hypothetical protein Pen02_83320 [Plantactinospora endophytica]
MDQAEEGARIGAALTGWLGRLAFTDQTDDEVTVLLIDSVAAWAMAQGWRVYRRAASVMPLPPPYEHRHSIVDVGCARPGGTPPVVIEVDHSDRQRSVDKLRLEAEAGRIALWLRWGERRFEPPPAPITMVPFRVTSRPGTEGAGRRYSKLPSTDRPAPAHLTGNVELGEQADLFPNAEATGPA